MIEINDKNYELYDVNMSTYVPECKIKINEHFTVHDMMFFLKWSDLIVERSGPFKKDIRFVHENTNGVMYGCYPMIDVNTKNVILHFDSYHININ